MSSKLAPINEHKTTAILVGVLFINAILLLFIGEAIYKPILGSPDYLEIAYPNRSTVIFGVLIEWFAIAPCIALIPVLLFPILRKQSEVLALGYVVFRLLEVVLLSTAEVNKLSLIGVSEAYLNASGVGASMIQNIASAIQAETYWIDSAGPVYNLVFVAGALMLYAMLFKSRLVPRFISVWGWFAAVLLLAGSLVSEFLEISPALAVIIWTPIALNELALAAWLIFKGFNPAALPSGERNEYPAAGL